MNKTLRIFTVLLTVLYFFSSTAIPVLAAITYTYDQNGNMTSDGTECFEYNGANQLKKVKHCGNNQTIAEYIYAPQRHPGYQKGLPERRIAENHLLTKR
jgi:hypothetical protein